MNYIMGILSFFKSIGNGIKHAFTSAGNAVKKGFNSVKSGISSLAKSIGSGIKSAADTAKKAVSTVYQNTEKFYNKVVDDTIGKQGIINNAVNRTTGILSTPLILIGGGIAAFLLFSGRNSAVNISK